MAAKGESQPEKMQSGTFEVSTHLQEVCQGRESSRTKILARCGMRDGVTAGFVGGSPSRSVSFQREYIFPLELVLGLAFSASTATVAQGPALSLASALSLQQHALAIRHANHDCTRCHRSAPKRAGNRLGADLRIS